MSKDHVAGDQSTAVNNVTTPTSSTTIGAEGSYTVLLQVVPLRVIGHNGMAVSTYAMLDSGSEITLVDPSLVRLLRLCGQPD